MRKFKIVNEVDTIEDKVIEVGLTHSAEHEEVSLNVNGITIVWLDTNSRFLELMTLLPEEEKVIRDAGFSVIDHHIAMGK